ncbi:MAG: hypothetical protein M1812_001681 [Candelaria pacifica]|nr:MAG: hypothetical protein M1812_001681 [Candelaria pacifica]
MPRSWPLSARNNQGVKDVTSPAHHTLDRGETLPDTQVSVSKTQQMPASLLSLEDEHTRSRVMKPEFECTDERMLQLNHEASAEVHSHFFHRAQSEETCSDSEFDPETAFLTPIRSNSPEPEPPLNISHNLATSHSSTDLCEDCSRNVQALVTANTLRNAQIMESSIDIMVDSYKKHMALNPELDTRKNRKSMHKHLMAHVNEEDGGTVNWEGYVEDLKEKGIVEDCIDEGLIMIKRGSSGSLGKRVRFPDHVDSMNE